LVETGFAPDGTTIDGLKLQMTPAGKPEQAKVTGELKPLLGVTFRVAAAGIDFVMVPLAGLIDKEKSGVGAGAIVTETPLEVEAEKALLPSNLAVMAWLPTGSVDVV
jgi:hypothetical protein